MPLRVLLVSGMLVGLGAIGSLGAASPDGGSTPPAPPLRSGAGSSAPCRVLAHPTADVAHPSGPRLGSAETVLVVVPRTTCNTSRSATR